MRNGGFVGGEPVVFVAGGARAWRDSAAFAERHGGYPRAEANGVGVRFVPERPCGAEDT